MAGLPGSRYSPGRTGMQEVENIGPSGVASQGRPAPRGAIPPEEVMGGAPLESIEAPDRRRPNRP